MVEGTVLTREWLCAEAEKLLSLTVEERRALRGMEPRRADVIAGGCLLMYSILNRFNADRITVSESDNLEGYVLFKGLVK